MKPLVSSPTFRASADMPKFTLLLSSLESFIERAGGPQSILTTLHRVKIKALAWRGEGDAPSWLLTADDESIRALLLWRSELIMADADRHADLAAKILDAIKRMRQSLADSGVTMAVEPATPVLRKIIKTPTTRCPVVSWVLKIADAEYSIVMPADSDDAHLVAHELMVAVRTGETLATIPPGMTGSELSGIELQTSLSRLRALGALNDGGPIRPQDRSDYRPHVSTTAHRPAEGVLAIGSR